MKSPRVSKSSGRISKARSPARTVAAEAPGKLGASLQDAALERFTEMIAALEQCHEPTLAETTHEIRRHGKKLRALLRLVRSCLGRRAYEAEDASLFAMGRAFGKVRDAQVLIHTLDALRKRYFEGRRPGLLKRARQLLLAKMGRRARRLLEGDTVTATTAALQAARARCLDWNWPGFGWKEVLRALRQSYKRTRAAATCASAEPSVRRLHDWRKRTKELTEQVRLLHRLHKPTMDELAGELDVLAEFLGDDHDLTLLRDALVAHRATLTPARELDALLEVLELRRGELIRTAIDLGERLFEQTPKQFAAAMDECHLQHHATKKQARTIARRV